MAFIRKLDKVRFITANTGLLIVANLSSANRIVLKIIHNEKLKTLTNVIVREQIIPDRLDLPIGYVYTALYFMRVSFSLFMHILLAQLLWMLEWSL